ncbi:hypothetical protein Tco_1029977 [Tanacetum coccineum]|uniref:Uncharacterized protein n=1 Tax=Tanacetum coccineum TaxID=301880 RepID=A0ABQ5G5H4_9ASTR
MELTSTSPILLQRVRFTSEATIYKINTVRPWWLERCTSSLIEKTQSYKKRKQQKDVDQAEDDITSRYNNNNNNNKDVDGVVKFVLYDITKPQVASSSVQLAHGRDSVLDEHDGFTLPLLDSLLSKGLRTVKSIPPKCRLGFSRVLKVALNKVICTLDDISCWVSLLVLPLCLLKTFCSRNNLECKSGIKRQRQEESIVNAIRSWGIPGGSLQLVREALVEPSISWSNNDEENLDLGKRNVKQCKMKICDGHYTAAVRVLSSSRVAPYNDATLEDLKAKHPFKPASSLPHIPIDHHQLIASPAVVLEMIKSFPRGTSCSRDGLRAQHLMDCLSGVVITSLFRALDLVIKTATNGVSWDCQHVNWGLWSGVSMESDGFVMVHSVRG